MENIMKVIEFVKENGLGLTAKEGIIITDADGCIVFESDSKIDSFNQAAEWIDGNVVEASI